MQSKFTFIFCGNLWLTEFHLETLISLLLLRIFKYIKSVTNSSELSTIYRGQIFSHPYEYIQCLFCFVPNVTMKFQFLSAYWPCKYCPHSCFIIMFHLSTLSKHLLTLLSHSKTLKLFPSYLSCYIPLFE